MRLLISKPKEAHLQKIGPEDEYVIAVETDSISVIAEGITLSLADNWQVWQGRGRKRKMIGTEFVVRENISNRKLKNKKKWQVYKVTRRVFRRAK